MKKFFKEILTETDNKTYCFSKVASLIVLFVFIAGAVYQLYTHQQFSLTEFANGAMQLLFGSGAAIGAKQITTKTQIPPVQDPEK